MMNENMKKNKNLMMKSCTDCKTTKTPLWRGGPAGPKSLCNACGIRYRKKKRVIEGLKKRSDKKKDKQITNSTTVATANITTAKVVANATEKVDTSSNACPSSSAKGLVSGGDSFEMRLTALGKEVLLPKSPSPPPTWTLPAVIVKKQRCQRKRKLKEEEQAAFSLMALSCGFVFA